MGVGVTVTAGVAVTVGVGLGDLVGVGDGVKVAVGVGVKVVVGLADAGDTSSALTDCIVGAFTLGPPTQAPNTSTPMRLKPRSRYARRLIFMISFTS